MAHAAAAAIMAAARRHDADADADCIGVRSDGDRGAAAGGTTLRRRRQVSSSLATRAGLRADLAASGEEALQPAQLKASPMRSWIGLYALLYMLRQEGGTDFTREGIRATLEAATDVPMLEDLVLAALHDATAQIGARQQEALGGLGGLLGG